MNSCDICCDDFKYPITLSCGHKFCFMCAKTIKETNGYCPTCNSQIVENLDKITMKNVEKTTQEVFPCVRWIYNSRDATKWWYYDENINGIIENAHQSWLINKVQPNSLTIGSRFYDINFDNMEQTGSQRVRKIIRKEFKDAIEKAAFDKDNIRGITGIYYDKN